MNTNRFAILLFLFFLSFFLPAALSAAAPRYIHLEKPVYSFLDKAYMHGYLTYLPRSRPFTEKQVMAFLNKIETNISVSSKTVDKQFTTRLESMQKKYTTEKNTLISRKWDTGKIQLRGNLFSSVDMLLNKPTESVQEAGFKGSIDLSITDNFYANMTNSLHIRHIPYETSPYPSFSKPNLPDYNMFTFNLDTGESGFNHSASHSPGDRELFFQINQLSQFNWNNKYLSLSFARNTPSWGVSPVDNFCFSKGANPFTNLQFTLPLGKNGMFTWNTGFLQDFGGNTKTVAHNFTEKLVTAHRIEYQIHPRIFFSIYESVMYDKRFVLEYINPFNAYYISEVMLGSTDNKLGGAELELRIAGSRFYTALFADDIDFKALFSPNYYHNIYGFTIGGRTAAFHPKLLFTGEWTYLSHWMYTHWTNTNSYTHYGNHLGHFLEPNSHMLHTDADYRLNSRLSLNGSIEFIQHGRGDINTPADWDQEAELYEADLRDVHYAFLDFGIKGFTYENLLSVDFGGSYFLEKINMDINTLFTAEYSEIRNTENHSIVENSPSWNYFFTLEAKWSP